MTTPSPSATDEANVPAAAQWSRGAAAHVLGAGLITAVLIALPSGPSDLDRHQLPKELVVHLSVWLAVVLAKPARPVGIRPAMLWACLLLLAVSAVSSVVALNPWLAFRATALTASGIAAFVTARHLGAFGHSTTLLWWVAAAGSIAAGTGLAQAYGFSSPLFATVRAPGGTFGNRNFLAHFATLALPAVVTLTLTFRRTSGALVAALAGVAPVMMIVLSRSRAAWLGALAVAAVTIAWMVLEHRRGTARWPRIIAVAAAALVAATLTLTLPNTLQWRTDSPYVDTFTGIANHREGSGRGRILQYRHSMELAARHPLLGVGPGNWPLRYGDVAPGNDPSWSHGDVIPLNPWPSSDWMALLSERGIPAVVILLMLGAAVCWRGVRGIRAGDARAAGGSATIALVAAVAIQGGFDAVMLLPAPLLLAALSAGALLDRADGAIAVNHERRTAPAPWWWLAIPALLALGALRSVQQNVAFVVAGRGADRGRLNWAARIDPWSYPIRIALATREPCRSGRDDAAAALRLAPTWPAARVAARRCGVELR